jgi:hypothetical protein
MRHVLLTTLLSVGILFACAVEPGEAMSLVGTAWRVTAIDGEQIGRSSAPVLQFDVERVTVWTGCRTVAPGYYLDTSGSALQFESIALDGDAGCSEQQLDQEARLVEALARTEGWAILSHARIRFEGGHELVLDREPA